MPKPVAISILVRNPGKITITEAAAITQNSTVLSVVRTFRIISMRLGRYLRRPTACRKARRQSSQIIRTDSSKARDEVATRSFSRNLPIRIKRPLNAIVRLCAAREIPVRIKIINKTTAPLHSVRNTAVGNRILRVRTRLRTRAIRIRRNYNTRRPASLSVCVLMPKPVTISILVRNPSRRSVAMNSAISKYYTRCVVICSLSETNLKSVF